MKERRNLVREGGTGGGEDGRRNTYMKTPEQVLVKAFVRISYMLVWFIS